MISDWFDRYSLQARLAPALLSLFPLFLLIALYSPSLYETAAGLVSLALGCGVLTLVSHFARAQGKKIELKLNKKWGGRPTTRFLLSENGELDEKTRERYLAYFSQNVPNWELSDNRKQDIDSAVRWLLERTRDTTRFALIFKENISYGFRRNCLGMKPVGLIVSFVCLLYSGLQISVLLPDISNANPTYWIGFGVSFLLFIWWILVVNEIWIREAGDSYAKALLGSVDAFD